MTIGEILTLIALRYLKVLVLWPQSDKGHAELRLLYQSVNQSPCSVFRHSWIPLQGTWTSRPAAVYCRLLTANTMFGFWKYIIPWSFKADGWSCNFQQWHPPWLGCYSLSNSYRLWRGVVTAHTLVGVQNPPWTVVIERCRHEHKFLSRYAMTWRPVKSDRQYRVLLLQQK